MWRWLVVVAAGVAQGYVLEEQPLDRGHGYLSAAFLLVAITASFWALNWSRTRDSQVEP